MTTNSTTPPGVHPEAMLEPGTTCGDCAHLLRCTTLGFTKAENGWCDFIPIRFRAAAGDGHAAGNGSPKPEPGSGMTGPAGPDRPDGGAASARAEAGADERQGSVGEWPDAMTGRWPGEARARSAGRSERDHTRRGRAPVTASGHDARPPGRRRAGGVSRTTAGAAARERLERHGAATLTDEELLAVLVGGRNARAATTLLETCGTARQLAQESTGDLARIDGITPAGAAAVVAGIELGRRTLAPPDAEQVRLATAQEAAKLLLPTYGASPVEQFGIVSLSAKHRVLRTEVVSTGTLTSSPAHPREVFRTAAMRRAAAIILFHNHPSGDPTPSEDDIVLTARLQEAGSVMGIEVVDHIILADGRYWSFKESGRL